MTKIKNTAIYVRVSTEEQRDYGYSIDGQIRELTEYCNRNDYNIVDIYNDAGHSAKNLKRPNMERMISDIEKGKVNSVIALKIDRLTREGYDGQWFLRFCKEHNCELKFLYDNYDLSTPDGMLQYGMMVLFGERERREIGARTKRGMEEAVKQGKYPNKAPLGYIRNNDGRLEIDPIGSSVVKDIFDMYSKGMSALAISKIMKKDNRYINGVGKWHEKRVSNILNNPIYKGELHWGQYNRAKHDILVVPNHSPAIISSDIFDLCQRKKKTHGNYGEHIHIFHRIIKCPNCSKFMNSLYTIKKKNNNKKLNFYVRCDKKNCCNFGKIFNATKIEKELINVFNDLGNLYLMEQYILNFPNIKNKEELDSIQKGLKDLEHSEKRLLETLVKTDISIDLVNEKISTIKTETKKLLLKKEKLENGNLFVYNKDILKLLSINNKLNLKNCNIVWSLLNRNGKREIIERCIKSINVKMNQYYKIEITDIEFNIEFLQIHSKNISDYLIEKFKYNYNNIKYDGLININNLKTQENKNIVLYSELTKNTPYVQKCLNKLSETLKETDIKLKLIVNNDNQLIDALLFY